ncbi:kynureninase [Alicyclobacillus mengziensis]|uniref:Kynureninase n=1 Tax=Alicyclobacillus mengziensis TaxID=2931921 RepID=A0A9X7VXR4_9BACL|nr:kynureninase [Alicyclobacillus mengziensis]QSO47006.1 kynureninase [Alicyclobacillus mengziensis]
MTSDKFTRAQALELDKNDDLAAFRDRFYVQPGVLYFDGNSLGLLSKSAEAAIQQAVEAWKSFAVDGWTHGPDPWFHLPEKLGTLTASLIGAHPYEVSVSGSTTSNLHALLATFYRPSGSRTKILADSENFPSDLYAMHSHLALHNRPETDLILIGPDATGLISEDDIVSAMTDDVAVVVLPSVWYKSGQLVDMERLTKEAHRRGIVIGFDLAHSIGVIGHHVHDIGVDFAIWCNYKYVSAGPGATAGLYVHESHHDLAPGLAGWFGSDKERQFNMEFPLAPAASARKWQLGTPPILSTVAIGASLELIQEAGIAAIRAKSLNQTTFLRQLLEHFVIEAGLGGQIRTPREDDHRGGHIAFEHEDAVQLGKALRDVGVVPDFRPPVTLRFAPVPLYTSYQDIWDAVMVIRDLLQNGRHRQYSRERDVVS